MAGTTTTTLANATYANEIEARVLDELRPALTSREFLRWGAKGNSTVFKWTLQSDPGPGTAMTEGTEFATNTAITTTASAAATAAEEGMMTTVTDMAIEVSIFSAMQQSKEVILRATLEQWETDLGASMDNFGTATTAASTLTPDDFLRAVSAIEQRDAATGAMVAYLHPKQSGELRAEVAATTALVTAGQATGGVPTTPVTGATNGQGDWGSLFGVRVYQSSVVLSSAGLRQGSISVSGQCIGAYELWMPRVETERRASLRGFFVVASACYGLANVDVTNRGQLLRSAA